MQLRQMVVGGAGDPQRPESCRSRDGGGHDAVVAKDAVLYSGPVIVSLWSGDEGNEAQPKHSTWDKSCSVSVCTRSSLQSESWLLPPLPLPISSCLTPSSAPRRTGQFESTSQHGGAPAGRLMTPAVQKDGSHLGGRTWHGP